MKKLLFILLVSLPFYTNAQETLKHIPQSASWVLNINISAYNEHNNFSELINTISTPKIKPSFPEGYHLLQDPSQTGIRLEPSFPIFMNQEGEDTYMAWLFPVNNSKLLTDYIEGAISESGKAEKFFVEKNDKFNIFLYKNSGMAWNKDMAVWLELDTKPMWMEYESLISYDDPDYQSKVDSIKKQVEIENGKLIKKQLVQHLQPVKNNILAIKDFQDFIKTKAHASFWMSAQGYMQMINNSFGRNDRETRQLLEFLNHSFSDNFVHMYANLYDGKTDLTITLHPNEKNFDLLKVIDHKINPDLLNYIDGRELFGIMGMSVDLNAYYREYKKIILPELEKSPKHGKQVVSILELVDMIIDEDAILGVLQGDAVFAITGMRTMEVAYDDYQYGEDGQYLGSERKIKKEPLPLFTLVAGAGNRDNIQTIVSVLEAFELIKKEHDYYVFPKFSKMPLFLGINEDVIMLTNDNEAIQNLKKGVKKKNRIDPKIKDRFTQYSSAVFIDLEPINQYFIKMKDEKTARILEVFNGEIEGYNYLDHDKKIMVSKGTYTTLSKENNLLQLMLNLIIDAR